MVQGPCRLLNPSASCMKNETVQKTSINTSYKIQKWEQTAIQNTRVAMLSAEAILGGKKKLLEKKLQLTTAGSYHINLGLCDN